MAKILFIAPSYFNYHTMLISEMISQGHSVDFLPDTNDTFFNLLLRRLALQNYNAFQKQVREHFERNNYTTLLVIGGRRLTTELLHDLREEYSSVKFIMYQWDSIGNFDYRSIAKYFDSVKTFDSLDAKSNGFGYLPLFYKKNSTVAKNTIDFLFIGIWHSDRIEVLTKIYEHAKKRDLVCDFRVYYPYYIYLYLIYIKKLKIKSPFFVHKPISQSVTQRLYTQARCIVDISHPLQTGLTMRSIETLGQGKKLLTSNRNIISEHFYNNSQIQIFDRDQDEIDLSFIDDTHQNSENISNLEISNWVRNLING